VPDRLSPLDVSFLYLEEPTTPMHVGGVVLFQQPEGGFDYERLVSLIEGRIALVPRYRQKVRGVPGRLANPVWIDDEEFDVGYHVRRSALPRPGSDAQLRDLVGRIMARPLDRNRPLWEMYLVEGLQGGRFALLTKTHHAMVDGAGAVDIGQVILDLSPEPEPAPPVRWTPRRPPSDVELVTEAVGEVLRSPGAAIDAVRSGAIDVRETTERVARRAAGLASALITMARPPSANPLNAPIGEARRFGMAAMRLEDFKVIRRAHGGTINDVVLAVTAGALREWMMMRGESVSSRTAVRALVPVSVRDAGSSSGNHIAAFLVDLPVGEPQPIVRLHRLSYEMEQLKSTGQMVGAQALVGIAGFAPPSLHAAAARTVNDWSRRMFNLVVTNVPGPQFPLYAGGALMLGAYPVVPLAKGQAVSIGLTSYDGGMFFGLNADRDAMNDVDVLAECLENSLAELLDTVPPSVRRRRRGSTSAGESPREPRRAATRAAAPRKPRPKRAAPVAHAGLAAEPDVDLTDSVVSPAPETDGHADVPVTAAPEQPAEPAAGVDAGGAVAEPVVRPRQVSSSASRGLVGNRRRHPAG
jgi:diacylglycerol O-acyltransferase / wax synthase